MLARKNLRNHVKMIESYRGADVASHHNLLLIRSAIEEETNLSGKEKMEYSPNKKRKPQDMTEVKNK